ncbi:MAG: hypothetical protein JWO47_850 [Candidatus Saccharibacteria bacterium]|nr:hypothetical protein [Candidatus Saccharibacteria bacterium]
MKQKDIVIIGFTIVVAGIFSYVICNNFLFTAKDQKQNVEVVAPITSEFLLPDKAIFNTDAINPTKVIEIAPNTNNQPFTNAE